MPPFAPSPAAFNHDVALLQLASASGDVPAQIASRYPSQGESVSIVGYGSSALDCSTPAGTKNFRDVAYSNTVNYVCGGDSGGPLLLGAFASNGTVAGVVSSGAPAFGNAVMFREDVAAVMRAWDGGFENGVNRPGFDLAGMPLAAGSAAACSSLCDANAACVSFTWTTSNQCWLKSTMPAWAAAANCTSGVRTSRASAGVATWETNTNRDGGAFFQYSTTHADCRAQCLKDGRCKAYTFAGGTCYLKSYVPPPSQAAGVWSGVRKIATLDQARAGTLVGFQELSYPVIEDCAAACRQNASCRSYTYRRPEVGTKAACWMYSNVPAPAPAWGFATGTLAGGDLVLDDHYGYF